jgi:hypothetical protein
LSITGNIDATVAEVTQEMVASNFPVHAISPKKLDLETLFRDVNESEGSQ